MVLPRTLEHKPRSKRQFNQLAVALKIFSFERISQRSRDEWAVCIIELATLIGILVIIAFFSTPAEIPLVKFYACPFHKLTGYDCPGCGMTRACMAILHGDFLLSFRFNAGGLFVVIFAALRIVKRLCELILRRSPALHVSWTIPASIAIAIILYGLARLILELCGSIAPLH